ncbi:hypothetical protein C499_12785 [Halogeometricum borinquense DSM 11551]|uniref:Uncharacterized protein n=1 Tax=Halogeometricum borinquense (strain ATCC 700274 / DSM 11551 / JCM 10706 / KCTC 4070 / PR3) TaxID=469382 RepID=E4NWN0_HALBP|nr:hypothetical protein [Halogeometricum borinquense]ADQ69450.1 hypothetical protein Hbor_37440 [Halogeometricum borinquense DSM 11551]ELY25758.1 hypothetical protein C499_12785 [Halogeometricum borinquense DSM 11551]
MVRIAESVQAVGAYILSLFTALIVAMLAGVVVGGNAEPRTISRAVVVLVFFTTLIGSMIFLKKYKNEVFSTFT